MQIGYETGDRVLADGHLFEVVELRRNRWGGQSARLASVDGTAAPRWLTPRLDRARSSVVDRRALHAMVHGFYARVRADESLGPIFESRLHARWDEHLERMVCFWSSALLDERSFVGEPMAKHRALADATPIHFVRWLEHFHAQLGETFAAAVGPSIARRALMMARGLSTGMFGAPFDALVPCS